MACALFQGHDILISALVTVCLATAVGLFVAQVMIILVQCVIVDSALLDATTRPEVYNDIVSAIRFCKPYPAKPERYLIWFARISAAALYATFAYFGWTSVAVLLTVTHVLNSMLRVVYVDTVSKYLARLPADELASLTADLEHTILTCILDDLGLVGVIRPGDMTSNGRSLGCGAYARLNRSWRFDQQDTAVAIQVRGTSVRVGTRPYKLTPTFLMFSLYHERIRFDLADPTAITRLGEILAANDLSFRH